MTIQARYVDTCVSDYLQDHHHREGECLAGAYLGLDAIRTAQAMLERIDNIPERYDDDAILNAIATALIGVDLRANDDLVVGGNESAQVWILLTWGEPTAPPCDETAHYRAS